MPAGNIFIYISFFLVIIGIFTSILRLKTNDYKFLQYSRLVTVLLFLTISATLIYLYILFLTSDISIEYVWQYTSVSHPIHYKIAGVLAGMAGSLLFWVWAIITPWIYVEIKTIKKPINEDIREWTRIGLFIVMLILIYVLLIHDIFKPTAANFLTLYPNGYGLDPLLQTNLMVIHPPVVFLAYGILVLPFAAAIAYLITGHKDWIKYSLNWSRMGWILLTLGIGLGAIWAYVVLGWGGYWAWDPVETSSLLPWIILTGFLHTQLIYKRKNDYPILAPVLGVTSFILIIFATFVTRAGGLWVSVHTFGKANVEISPVQRFINILSENQIVSIYFVFIILFLIITAILSIYRYNKVKKSREEQYFTIGELISDDLLMLVTIFLFIITGIVTIVILISSVNSLNPSVFNFNIGLLGLVIILTLIFCMIWRYTGRKWIVILGVCTLLASAIGFIIFRINSLVATSLPILIVALLGACYKIIKSFSIGKIRKSIKPVSAQLIHLAIILLLLGFVGSNFLVWEKNVSLTLDESGENVGKYIIYATDFEELAGINFVEIDVDNRNFAYQTKYVDVEVRDGNSIIGYERLIIITSTSKLTDENKLVRNEIKVIGTPLEDIYLTYSNDYIGNEENIVVDITVKILPLMKLVWIGMWLMIIGMFIRIISEKKWIIKQDLEKKEDKGAEKTKNGNYYEDLVEEELEKLKKV
jgi:cytochrome c-type biogenesis protein CcmF